MMATSWKAQQSNGEYALQFETDDKQKYNLVEKVAMMAVDGKTAADVVPVVRCKDCEHGLYMDSCSMYLCRCTGGKLRYADNYCNYGERREQE